MDLPARIGHKPGDGLDTSRRADRHGQTGEADLPHVTGSAHPWVRPRSGLRGVAAAVVAEIGDRDRQPMHPQPTGRAQPCLVVGRAQSPSRRPGSRAATCRPSPRDVPRPDGRLDGRAPRPRRPASARSPGTAVATIWSRSDSRASTAPARSSPNSRQNASDPQVRGDTVGIARLLAGRERRLDHAGRLDRAGSAAPIHAWTADAQTAVSVAPDAAASSRRRRRPP